MRSILLAPLMILALSAQAPPVAQREPELWKKAEAGDVVALEALALKTSGALDNHLVGRLAVAAGHKPMSMIGGSALMDRMKDGFDPFADRATAPFDLVLLESLASRSDEARKATSALVLRMEALPAEDAAALLAKSRSLGSKEAAGFYGLHLIEGKGLRKDAELGFKHVLESDSTDALVRAGELLEWSAPRNARRAYLLCREAKSPDTAYRAGQGLERLAIALEEPGLETKAEQAYRHAKEDKHALSIAALARFATLGRKEARPNYKEARTYAEEAIASGAAEGHYWLGWLDTRGLEGPKSPASALAHFQAGAKAGDARCAYELGLAYQEGQGVPKDPHMAETWFTQAAERGYAPAALAAAKQWLAQGKHQEARAKLEIAAKGGQVAAQLKLAELCEEGLGGPQDFDAARYWWERASAQREGQAFYHLALLRLDGASTKTEAEAVLDLLRQASREGYLKAQALLKQWGY